MTRREIIKYTSYITGATLCAPVLGSILSGCKADMADIDIQFLNFFSKEELTSIEKIIDTILPKSDSPAATEVGVHYLIDRMVGQVYSEKQKEDYRKGFESLISHLKDSKNLTQTFLDIEKGSVTDEVVKNAYHHIKQQTVAYYLSTEEIGINFLNYLPVPGEYVACTTLEEVGGKAWTL